MCNNAYLDLVNINAYAKLGEKISIHKIVSGNEILTSIKGQNASYKFAKLYM